MSFNTAVSFLTNTNWQNYSGESTMSHLTQMAGLALHNFVSAAAGAAVAVALIRGLVRRRTAHARQLLGRPRAHDDARFSLPLAIVFTLVLVSQGAVQNFHAATHGHDGRPGRQQTIPGGPIASQEAIKEIGENGGGPYNANSSHPFENPNPITNILEIWMLLAIPFAFPWTFGKMAGDVKQGIAVLSAMFVLWLAVVAGRDGVRGERQPQAHRAVGANQQTTATAVGREHGGQGGPVRSGRVRAVRGVDDRNVDRLGQLRCTTASRRSAAPRRS